MHIVLHIYVYTYSIKVFSNIFRDKSDTHTFLRKVRRKFERKVDNSSEVEILLVLSRITIFCSRMISICESYVTGTTLFFSENSIIIANLTFSYKVQRFNGAQYNFAWRQVRFLAKFLFPPPHSSTIPHPWTNMQPMEKEVSSCGQVFTKFRRALCVCAHHTLPSSVGRTMSNKRSYFACCSIISY